MIVTIVLSSWTKDSRPEKFDLALLTLITVGMALLSFTQILYHILANKGNIAYVCQKVKMVSKLHIDNFAESLIQFCAEGKLCRENQYLS